MPDNQDSGQGGQGNQDQGQQGDQGAQGAADQAAAKAAADAAAAAKPIDFKGSLPEEYRADPAADKFKNTGELFKSYKELEKLVGLEKIPLPKKDKDGNYDPEGMRQVALRLGMPKDPAGYQFEKKVKIPDGLKADETAIGNLKGLYHKLGLLPHQAEGVTQFMMDTLGRAQTEQGKKGTVDRQTAENGLRAEWGAKFDQNINLARKAMKAFTDEADQSYIDQGIGNDPKLIKIFAKIGESMSEDQIDKGTMLDETLTPAQAAAEISDIRNNKANPMHAVLMNQLHPEHGKVLERLADLYKMAHPA